MKKIATSIVLLFLFISVYSQKDSIEVLFGYRITDYTVKLNDSVTVVQVNIPEELPLTINDKQIGILKHRYQNGALDTSIIGIGRCHLIKGRFFYFAINKQNAAEPEQGDILYTRTKLAAYYQSPLFDINRHAIDLTTVYETPFYNSSEIFQLDQKKENVLLDSMVADIKFTGAEMKTQMPGQNQIVDGGMFNGKKLFDAMETTTRMQLTEFLKYIVARPEKYAGNTWKLSEIYATWIVSKAPQVIQH